MSNKYVFWALVSNRKTFFSFRQTQFGETSSFLEKRQFKNYRIYKDLYGKPCRRDWMAKVVFLIQMLPTFDGRRNRYF